MNCGRVEELASEYLEHSLGANDSHAIDVHLKSCSACTGLLAVFLRCWSQEKCSPFTSRLPGWRHALSPTHRVSRGKAGRIPSLRFGNGLWSRVQRWPYLPRRWFWVGWAASPESHRIGPARFETRPPSIMALTAFLTGLTTKRSGSIITRRS